MTNTELLYSAYLAQVIAESHLHGISASDPALRLSGYELRLRNGNNHFEFQPDQAAGGTRLAKAQREEALGVTIDATGVVTSVSPSKGYDVIDHLPNQASGFSATLLRNKSTGDYTLAFRSTEFRDIENGGDAQRDSVRGAAGDIVFNGMAFAQVSSMERYWKSLLDGSRALGATPDNPGARDTAFLRTAELATFRAGLAAGSARLNVSGFSLGGHLATVFAMFHGEAIASLFLFNSAGVGDIRPGFSLTAYKDALETYEAFMRPGMADAAVARLRDWARRAGSAPELSAAALLRLNMLVPDLAPPFIERPFVPKQVGKNLTDAIAVHAPLTVEGAVAPIVGLFEAQKIFGIPRGADRSPIVASSALHYLVSLFASEPLIGVYGQTVARASGVSFASLQERGLIPASVSIHQVSGRAAAGAPSLASFKDMRQATDWEIVANSGIRAAPDAALLPVYIENQPTAAGLPFTDKGWGDFGNTHSITLIGDTLAVLRMLQKAQPSLTQASAEEIFRAASNLRKEHYSFLPARALAEHDTLERVVDSFGRLLFGRTRAREIDWSRDLASSDGISAFGQLVYRDPLHARIQAIEAELEARGLAGAVSIESLAGLSAAELVAEASARTARGTAFRYALKELDAFVALGASLHGAGRDDRLALYDPVSGTGSLTGEWLTDRAAFLALKLRLGVGDFAYERGAESIVYRAATGDVGLVAAPTAAGLGAPDKPVDKRTRERYAGTLEGTFATHAGRRIVFGADGDPAADPSTAAGGADRLRGDRADDRLYGEGGNDDLYGAGGADYLEGGAGDDMLVGAAGSDTLAGGPGVDTYLRNPGDGNDRIVETREASGQMRGVIVIRLGKELLVPREFKRDPAVAGEVYRSPDKRLVLTHASSWILAFAGGEIDLGEDLRNGDFGFKLEGLPAPRPPTVVLGAVQDDVVPGPNRGSAILASEYGHDRLFALGPTTVEAALLVASAAPLPGWGYWLAGGPGDDLGIASPANDVLIGGGGADTLLGGPGADLIEGDGEAVPVMNFAHLLWDYRPDPRDGYFVEHTGAGFMLTGTPVLDVHREQLADGDDVLHGGGGDDYMYGTGGRDTLHGDAGNDVLVGGEGADVLLGGEGADRITGEQHGYAPIPFEVVGGRVVTYLNYVAAYGDDIADGGAGNDELSGEGGADVLYGGEGTDKLYGDIAGLPADLHGADVLDGGEGSDELYGHGGDDLLFGGAGADLLIGDSEVEARRHGADLLDGGEDDDVLIGAGGADELMGGEGADTLLGDAIDLAALWHGDDVLDGGAGADLLFGLGGADELYGGDGNDRLFGDDPDTPGLGLADVIDGGAGDDVIRGQTGDDRLLGGSGSDHLLGEAGNDTLNGGPGADVLEGGAGDNVYELTLGDGADRIVAGTGLVTLAFLDGVDVPALRASRVAAGAGIAPIEIEYGAGDSVRVEGLADARRLRIRIGDAELLDAADLMQLSAAGGAARGSDASEIMQAGASAAELFALAGDDLIVGSPGADRLHGGAGDDALHGLAGDDALSGDEGGDALYGGLGNDLLEGGPGDDRYAFEPGAGRDSVAEVFAEGDDRIELPQGVPLAEVRLRRGGNDLVISERAGAGRLFVRDWYREGFDGFRSVETIVGADGSLDADAIAERVLADRFVMGTGGADALIGDEFDDVFVGGAGDDTLDGGAGNDRYVHARGDGRDIVLDSGGMDVVELGPGIAPADIALAASPDGAGGLVIALRVGGAGEIRFAEARDKRIEEFHFASGEVFTYAALLRLAGGLRIEGTSAPDTITGTYFADAVYGFGGDDTLRSDEGEDLIVGGAGHDSVAGGAHSDTYVFNRGDGRDTIVEYRNSDEHLLFDGFFTSSGHRAFVIDGVTFVSHSPPPGFLGETFNVTLGDLNGGADTLRFGEGIIAEDIRFGLDLSRPALAYSWIVPTAPGSHAPGLLLAAQVGYVLELGAGDAIEIVLPNADPALRPGEHAFERAPVEWLVFGASEPVRLADAFAAAGGLSFLTGTGAADVLEVEQVLPGGWLAGSDGDDVYARPEQGGLGILERAGGGTDTIVFGEAVSEARLRFEFHAGQLSLDTGMGRVQLRGFDALAAEVPLVERYELSDGSTLDYETLLARGIAISGSSLDDTLAGTSVYDDVRAGAGNDLVDTGAGNDIVDGEDGNDSLQAGPGDDFVAAGRGSDWVSGGLGSDRYLYVRGDGDDLIEERGAIGEDDTLVFGGDITPSEVGLRRAGSDLVLELAGSGRVTMRAWFADEAMRVESVTFRDGTVWDVARMRELAGDAPAPPDTLPPPPPPPPTATEPPASAPPVASPPAAPTLPAEPPASHAPSVPAAAAPAATSEPPAGPVPAPAAAPVPGAATLPIFAEPAAVGSASRSSDAADSAAAAVVSAPAASVAAPVSSAALAAPPSGIVDALAALGFVSPGRASRAPSEPASDEPVSPDTAPDAPASADTVDSAAADAMGSYWRWMHARLDAHLAEAEVEDLGAPVHRPGSARGLGLEEGLGALSPVRAVGLRGGAGLELRGFEGLKDGMSFLGSV